MLLLSFRIFNYIQTNKKKDPTKAFLSWIDLDIWYIHPLLEVSNLVPDSGLRISQREYLQRVGIIGLAPGVSGRGWAPEEHRGGTLHVGLLGPVRPLSTLSHSGSWNHLASSSFSKLLSHKLFEKNGYETRSW